MYINTSWYLHIIFWFFLLFHPSNFRNGMFSLILECFNFLYMEIEEKIIMVNHLNISLKCLTHFYFQN